MATLVFALMARSQISAPASAISSLLAVTTDLPCSMAPSTTSRATAVPPTSSATISTSGRPTSSRQSVVRIDAAKTFGQLLVLNGAAAHRGHIQLEAEFCRDLFRVPGQHTEGPHADVAKADNADVHLLHM